MKNGRNVPFGRLPVTAGLLAALLAALTLTAAFTSCAKSGGETIRIGTKSFTENLILGEIYALALENAGLKVERRFNLASSVVHTALVNNEIDLYPEYTGTGLLTILKLPLETNPQKVFEIVKDAYAKQFNLVWLDYAQANDGQGIAVTTEASAQYGIKTISDLQRSAGNIRFASQGEFDMREDALPLLVKVYGPFDWKSTSVYSESLKAQVLLSGEADAMPTYTTEGILANGKFVLLTDDKEVWPPYNIAPVVRKNVLDAQPAIASVLNGVNKKISTEIITALNAEVDIGKRDYDEVAKEFFAGIK